MKKAAKEQEQPKKKSKKTEEPEWSVLKSGAMKHREGKWYASECLTGWYFYTRTFDNNQGPYKSFESGLQSWKNV